MDRLIRFAEMAEMLVVRRVVERLQRFTEIQITVDGNLWKTNADVSRRHRSTKIFIDIRIEMDQIRRTSEDER